MKAIPIFILVFFLQFTQAFAENWPHWRGPRRDGTSAETKLPVKWSKTENVVWRLALPEAGAATPVIWGDRIFVTSPVGNTLALYCISSEGKVLWRRAVGTGNKSARGDEGNFAAPSPSTDGKHVWVFFGSGDLACFDFEGNQIWKTNLQERYGKFNLYFVMASTPLLEGNRLYLQLIHSDASLVLALDKMTGREIWKHVRSSDAREECEHSYASPVIYRDGKNEFLLIHGADYITAHSLKDGSEIWRCGGLNPKDSYNPSLRFVASPVTAQGLIVVPSAKRGPVLGLKPEARGDVTNLKQYHIWRLPHATPDVPSPVIHSGLLYLASENGEMICVDAKTGAQIYREDMQRGSHRASPVYGDGKIYVVARNGVVTVVKAGPKFEILSKNEMGETTSASPAIANGRIYLRTFQAVYAIQNAVSRAAEKF